MICEERVTAPFTTATSFGSKRLRYSDFQILQICTAVLWLLPLGNCAPNCNWLPWHPQQASLSAAQNRIFSVSPQLCDEGNFITDFFCNRTEPAGLARDSPVLRYLSAKCSNGDYLGRYAEPDRNPSEPLSQLLATNSRGFIFIEGLYDSFLEDFGTEEDYGNGTAFRDECDPGALVVGYQTIYASGLGILQIRFLCSQPVSSSACGAQKGGPPGQAFSPHPWHAHASGDGPSSDLDSMPWHAAMPPLPPDMPFPGPHMSGQVFIAFALQWAIPESAVSIPTVEDALQALDRQSMSSIVAAGSSCIAEEGLIAPAKGQTVACFQLGPFPGFIAMPLIQNVTDLLHGPELQGELLGRNASYGPTKLLFAFVTMQPWNITGLGPSSSHEAQPARASTPVPIASHRSDAGLIAGCIVAGIAVLLVVTAAIWYFAWHRRRRSDPPDLETERGMDSDYISRIAAAKVLATQVPLPEAPPICKSVFADSSIPEPAWGRRSSWDRSNIRRQEKAERLQEGGSAPLPDEPRCDRAEALKSFISAEPPPEAYRIPSPFTMAPTESSAWHPRLTQDSDEAMQASLGGPLWQRMHMDSQATEASSSKSSKPVSGQNSARVGLEGSRRPSLSKTVSTEADADDWVILPSDLQICCRPDGSPIELGSGAFGKVYKALLNEVTEVAAKQLRASSQSQTSLFEREIAIHKRCRSAHVVQFLGACIEPNCMILVTELMHTSLDKIIHDNSIAFAWEDQGRLIAEDVAQALAYLHRQRVVHLDIKSRNVLLTKQARAKIADVGLSKVLQNTYLSQLDGLGTFAYAAPELLSGGSNCSFKADIWSFGVLLHEMVTREMPQRGALSKTQPHQCPAFIQGLIACCMARDPAERPSAKTLVKVLKAETPEEAQAMLTTAMMEEGQAIPSRGSSAQRLPEARKLARWSSMP